MKELQVTKHRFKDVESYRIGFSISQLQRIKRIMRVVNVFVFIVCAVVAVIVGGMVAVNLETVFSGRGLMFGLGLLTGVVVFTVLFKLRKLLPPYKGLYDYVNSVVENYMETLPNNGVGFPKRSTVNKLYRLTLKVDDKRYNESDRLHTRTHVNYKTAEDILFTVLRYKGQKLSLIHI